MYTKLKYNIYWNISTKRRKKHTYYINNYKLSKRRKRKKKYYKTVSIHMLNTHKNSLKQKKNTHTQKKKYSNKRYVIRQPKKQQQTRPSISFSHFPAMMESTATRLGPICHAYNYDAKRRPKYDFHWIVESLFCYFGKRWRVMKCVDKALSGELGTDEEGVMLEIVI